MSDTEYREDMSERGMVKPQSSIDEALMRFDKGLGELGQSITNLENRLGAVTNDHPRPTAGEVPKELRKDPSGDSTLLVQLRGLSAELSTQRDRIQALVGRLDI